LLPNIAWLRNVKEVGNVFVHLNLLLNKDDDEQELFVSLSDKLFSSKKD